MTTEEKLPYDDVPLVERPPGYRSYLLRLWQERSEQSSQVLWRFSLEDPLTARRQGFPSLEALTHWLAGEMNRAQDATDDDSD